MNLELTSNSIFRLKTQQQIAKDFAVHGYDFELVFLENALPLDELYEIVSEALIYFLEKKASSWQALLYTIDFSERDYLSTLDTEKTGPDRLHKLTSGIIQREAKKVHYRTLYSTE
jgi:hypothetical protein